MKYLMLTTLLLLSSCVQAANFVTTFVNTSFIDINLEVRFSDNSIANKGIAMSQSYQVVNFDNKLITSVKFSSLDKDKNGNFHGQLNKTFTPPTADTTYNIILQTVPTHIIPAGLGHEEFQMPESQTILCNVVTQQVPIDIEGKKEAKDAKQDKNAKKDVKNTKEEKKENKEEKKTAPVVVPAAEPAVPSQPVTPPVVATPPAVTSAVVAAPGVAPVVTPPVVPAVVAPVAPAPVSTSPVTPPAVKNIDLVKK